MFKATFYTILGEVYAQGIYKTKRSLRIAHDRYDNRYGAYLRMVVQEVSK